MRALEAFDTATVVIRSQRLTPAEETTAFAESLEVKEEASRVQSVSEVLSDAVGVQVRRLGGLGSYGAASIRGSTPAQVPIYLDGVLLNAGGSDAVNLGDLSLDMLERIDVYRGSTPAHLATAGIGGALYLHSRRHGQALTEAALSAGSQDSLRLFALRGDRFGTLDMGSLALLSAQTSDGDFDFFNDNCTPTNPEDDFTARRANNGHRSLSALFKLDGSLGPASGWRWIAADMAFAKRQGVAGIDCTPTTATRLATLRNTASLRFEGAPSDKLRLAFDASHLYLEETFRDLAPPHGELGLGRLHTLTRTNAAGLGGLLEIQASEAHRSTLRLDLRYERLDQRDHLTQVSSAPQARVESTLVAQHEWRPLDTLAILPAARLIWQHKAFGGGDRLGGLGTLPEDSSDDIFWQAGLGARWEFLPGLAFMANGGRYVRTPALAELFGLRGAVVGNPSLAEEQGLNADAGLVWRRAGPGWLRTFRAELAWFGTWADDLIVTVQNSQRTVRPENVDAARMLGLESSLRLNLWDVIGLSANYTWLLAVNRSNTAYYRGKRIPGRPEHEAFARIEAQHHARRWGIQAWFELDYAGQNYLNQYNNEHDALARLLFGAGLRLIRPDEGLTMTVQIKNLLDTRALEDAHGYRHPMRDFEAFPLPGRTIMATLHFRH